MGQAESPDPKFNGKWFFTIWLTTMGGGPGDSMGDFGPFETEAEAQKQLKLAVKDAMKVVSEKIGADPNRVIDMKDNKTKTWEEYNGEGSEDHGDRRGHH